MNKEDIIMLAVQTGQAIKNSELMEKYDDISAMRGMGQSMSSLSSVP